MTFPFHSASTAAFGRSVDGGNWCLIRSGWSVQSTASWRKLRRESSNNRPMATTSPSARREKVLASCFHPSTTKTDLELISAMSATRFSQMHRPLSCRYPRWLVGSGVDAENRPHEVQEGTLEPHSSCPTLSLHSPASSERTVLNHQKQATYLTLASFSSSFLFRITFPYSPRTLRPKSC